MYSGQCDHVFTRFPLKIMAENENNMSFFKFFIVTLKKEGINELYNYLNNGLSV